MRCKLSYATTQNLGSTKPSYSTELISHNVSIEVFLSSQFTHKPVDLISKQGKVEYVDDVVGELTLERPFN